MNRLLKDDLEEYNLTSGNLKEVNTFTQDDEEGKEDPNLKMTINTKIFLDDIKEHIKDV